jgi:hypothetical protein
VFEAVNELLAFSSDHPRHLRVAFLAVGLDPGSVLHKPVGNVNIQMAAVLK